MIKSLGEEKRKSKRKRKGLSKKNLEQIITMSDPPIGLFDDPLPGFNSKPPGSRMGLVVLSAFSAAGLYGVVSPPFFVLRSCIKSEEDRRVAVQGLWMGLGLSTAAALGIWLVFKDKVPAIVSGVTGLALFGFGLFAVKVSSLAAPTAVPMPPINLPGLPMPKSAVKEEV